MPLTHDIGPRPATIDLWVSEELLVAKSRAAAGAGR